MIEYIEGDIFKSPAQVIVNTVNTMGVMGRDWLWSLNEVSGNVCPVSYSMRKAIDDWELMLWYAPDYWILLFPTKKLEKAFETRGTLKDNKICTDLHDKSITSIAFPKLGCGNGEPTGMMSDL